MRPRHLLCAAAMLLTATLARAQVSFGGINLNSHDELLFTVRQAVPGTPAYQSLFLAHLDKAGVVANPQILTCYPERMEFLRSANTLQVRNRYGTAWYSADDKSLRWVALTDDLPVDYSRTGSVSVSPDGAYSAFIVRTSGTTGHLVLQSTSTLEQVILAQGVPFSLDSVCVKWSPDSAVLLYQSGGDVYFMFAKAAFAQVQIADWARKIGRGTIASVAWTDDKSLLYIDGDIVYEVRQNELYTRGLYAPLVGNGTIVGRLPYSFDAERDQFWSDARGSQIVVVSAENVASYYSLAARTYGIVRVNGMFPIASSGGAVLDCQVFWDQAQRPLLWVERLMYDDARRSSMLYAFQSQAESNALELVLEAKDSASPLLSPDGSSLAFSGGNSAYIYDINERRLKSRLRGEEVTSLAWGDSSVLYVGGAQTVRRWNIKTGYADALFLSSVSQTAWSGRTILATTEPGGQSYSYDATRNTWAASRQSAGDFAPSERNGRYRAFVGGAQNARFENALYVRVLSGAVVTYPVYPVSDVTSLPGKRVALLFDAVDDSGGLTEILSALSAFDIPAMFFVNGEFIRRYPAETRQIVAAGYECASGFFSTFDLTSSGFVIDKTFVKRGLARNEDEFLDVTQQELALFWHTPYYRATKELVAAGTEAGYRYVEVDPAIEDAVKTVPSLDALLGGVHDGMILPIPVGGEGGILQQNLDLLIYALLDQGYEIVSLRELL